MDDVFLSDPRQSSAKEIAHKMRNIKNKRGLKGYLSDLLIKSLIIFCLFAIDFTLFAEAGSYNIFSSSQQLTSEVGLIYATLLICAVAVIFVLSFSTTLQNFSIGIASAFLFLALVNQFALFDSAALLYSYTNSIGVVQNQIMDNYSHLILAGAIAFIVWLVFTYLNRRKQFYILLFLFLICGWSVSKAYFNPLSRNFIDKPYLNDESNHNDGDNVVIIAMPEAPSYLRLKNIDPIGKDADIRHATANILGFYMQNGFTYYPNAYLRYADQPFMNMVDILNYKESPKPEDMLMSSIMMSSYWDFNNLIQNKLYLSNNQLFNKYHKKDYNLRIYQGRGLELCTINSNLSVNRCLERVGIPINLNNTNFNPKEKATILAAQWLESTSLITDINPVLKILSLFDADFAPLNFSADNIYSFNSINVLDIISQDIINDKGNNLYFALLDMPSTVFMYDHLCNLKPLSQWVSADNDNIPLAQRHSAFAEQVSCTFGHIENFVQQLERNNKLKNTSIIILGLNTPFSSAPGIEKNIYNSLQKTKQVGVAIYDPKQEQAKIDNRLCQVSSIVNGWIDSDDNCNELEDFSITDKLKTDMYNSAKAQNISERVQNKAINDFKIWYKSWAAHHQKENNLIAPSEDEINEQINEDENDIKIDVAEVQEAEELPAETENKLPLEKTVVNEAEDSSVINEKPVKPQVNLEVKVIDNTIVDNQGKDILPNNQDNKQPDSHE